jgi:hypothetical protein
MQKTKQKMLTKKYFNYYNYHINFIFGEKNTCELKPPSPVSKDIGVQANGSTIINITSEK